ncbi:MAG TPA: glycerophosphodiester phosphodiesterase [Terriglobales bacterium]|nr:glycerophosphodiester phosphodiesterase [Terriglobales bacterium]
MPAGPLLLGHRGARASRSVAENTLPSFALALEHGCDGFEFDVRLSGSGRAIISHDDKVQGLTLSRTTLDEQLPLPVLRQVFELYAKRAFLDIELKVAGLESELLLSLRQHPPERGYVVSSFLPDILVALHALEGSLPLGIICDRRQQLKRWPDLPVGYVIPQHSLITKKLVDEVHRAGKILFAWTVNDKKTMLRLAGWGVNGIISDDTQLLVRTLR